MAYLDKITTRYARAIFEFLKTAEKNRTVIQELQAFSKIVASSHELQQVLTSVVCSESERRGVVEDLAVKLGLSADTKRVLLILAEQGRLTHLEQIAERLNQLVLEAGNTVPLSVTAALELSAEDKKKIEAKFQKVLGKQVEATYAVNPELLGGLKVTAGGRTFDGSLSGWLQGLEEKLVGGSL